MGTGLIFKNCLNFLPLSITTTVPFGDCAGQSGKKNAEILFCIFENRAALAESSEEP